MANGRGMCGRVGKGPQGMRDKCLWSGSRVPSVAIRVTNEPCLSPRGPQLRRVGVGVGREGGNKDEGDIDG